MPRVSDITYSREATVAAVRDYYQFLASLYLDKSKILEPPTGGWPSIPHDGWLNFDKTDEVVALLRELPYLEDADKIHGAPDCHFADWQCTVEDIDGENLKIWSEPNPKEVEIPAHIVGLSAVPREKSPAILLDTQLGVIYWYECIGEIKVDCAEYQQVEDDPYDWANEGQIPEDQVEWRVRSGIWAIEDFFKMLKANFRRLSFVPVGPREVRDIWAAQTDKETLVKIQNVYHDHGWPDLARFDKEKCLVEIRSLLEVRDQVLAK